MKKLPNWWGSKEFDNLEEEQEKDLLYERLKRLENFCNGIVEWINNHESRREGMKVPKEKGA